MQTARQLRFLFLTFLVAAVLATGSAQAQTYTESVLYSFKWGTDGAAPQAGLVRDAQGNLYGTTSVGGGSTNCSPYGCGTVFEVDTTGNENVLHNFTAGEDGYNPEAGLVRDAQGNLYGTTYEGGDPACNCGTVFKVDTTGKETVLHRFTGTGGDGAYPHAGLVQDAQGNLYGTTPVAEGRDHARRLLAAERCSSWMRPTTRPCCTGSPELVGTALILGQV